MGRYLPFLCHSAPRILAAKWKHLGRFNIIYWRSQTMCRYSNIDIGGPPIQALHGASRSHNSETLQPINCLPASHRLSRQPCEPPSYIGMFRDWITRLSRATTTTGTKTVKQEGLGTQRRLNAGRTKTFQLHSSKYRMRNCS